MFTVQNFIITVITIGILTSAGLYIKSIYMLRFSRDIFELKLYKFAKKLVKRHPEIKLTIQQSHAHDSFMQFEILVEPKHLTNDEHWIKSEIEFDDMFSKHNIELLFVSDETMIQIDRTKEYIELYGKQYNK